MATTTTTTTTATMKNFEGKKLTVADIKAFLSDISDWPTTTEITITGMNDQRDGYWVTFSATKPS